jgi:hypothetical protein
MAKPAVPRWAALADGTPAANIVVPAAGQCDQGYAHGDTPTSGVLNHLLGALCQWAKWLNTLLDTANTWTALQNFNGGITSIPTTADTNAIYGVGNGIGVGVRGDGGVYGIGGNVNLGPGVIAQAAGIAGGAVRGAIQLVPQVAPSAPANGDVWVDKDANVLHVRINGVTKTVTLT